MKNWIIIMLLSATWLVNAQQLSDQQLIGMLDLTRADMKVVAQYAGQANYAAAKAGVIGFSKSSRIATRLGAAASTISMRPAPTVSLSQA